MKGRMSAVFDRSDGALVSDGDLAGTCPVSINATNRLIPDHWTDLVRSKYSADVQNSYSVVQEMLNRVGFGSTCVSKCGVHGQFRRVSAKETQLSFALTSDKHRKNYAASR